MRTLVIFAALLIGLPGPTNADDTSLAPDFRLQDQYGEWHELGDESLLNNHFQDAK